jgi:ribosome-associated toxin RatA of RatAB toxin-antitoxin module
MILESPAKNTSRERSVAKVERSAHVTYTREQMFDLVNDVEQYPKFLHWCRGARVDAHHGNSIEATLQIGGFGFEQSLRTRNTLQRPERIGIDLVSGPFRSLRGEWRFVATNGGTDISLRLEFEATSFGGLFARVFEELAAAQMAAFVARAAKIYASS